VDADDSGWRADGSGCAPTEIFEADGARCASLRVLGNPVAARVFITASDGRAYAPDDAWMYADDSFDRAERPFEAHYFDTSGASEITVPVGEVEVDVMRGFENHFEQRKVEVKADSAEPLTIRIAPLSIAGDATSNWMSGDVHTHMNYAGTYRNTPAHLVEQAAAENLAIVEDLVVNKEQRIPDMAYISRRNSIGFDRGSSAAARAGISHQLLGTSGIVEPDS
jgi:hypothetical protein